MEIGTSILHYKIPEKLGEGGMGVVYKARDTKLDPISANSHTYYAWYLCAMSLEEEYNRELGLARKIDPLSPSVREIRQAVFILTKRYDDAIQEARSSLQIFPDDYGVLHLFMETAYSMRGDSALAVEQLDPIMEHTQYLRENDETPAWNHNATISGSMIFLVRAGF